MEIHPSSLTFKNSEFPLQCGHQLLIMSSSSCTIKSETERYAPFVLATNAALDKLRDVQVAKMRPPSKFEILAHTSDPQNIHDYHGAPMTITKRRPDIIFTSLHAARKAACKPNARWAEIATTVATERPRVRCDWYDIFSSIEMKSSSREIQHPIRMPHNFPPAFKHLGSMVDRYFNGRKRHNPPMPATMSGSKRLKKGQFASTQPTIPEDGPVDGITSNSGFVSNQGTPRSASTFTNLTDLHGCREGVPPGVGAACANSKDGSSPHIQRAKKSPALVTGTNSNPFRNEAGTSASTWPPFESGLQKEDTSLQVANPSQLAARADAAGISPSKNISIQGTTTPNSVVSLFNVEQTRAIYLGSSADKEDTFGVVGAEMLSGSFGVLHSFSMYIEGMLLEATVRRRDLFCYRRRFMDLVL